MTDAYRTGPSQVGGTSTGTVDAVNDETSTLTGDAADAGRNVVDTAKEEAAGVVEDVKFELADLFDQAKDELREQAATQQNRAAEGLHTVSEDLRGMAQTSTGGLGRAVTAAPALAAMTSTMAATSVAPSDWARMSSPASAAIAGSSDIRTPNTAGGSRRSASSSSE